MKLYLIRHGQTHCNVNQVNSHPQKTTLTDLGEKQAEAVAKELENTHFDVAFISTNTRAKQTAIPFFLQGRFPFFFESNLGEHDVGDMAGMPHGSIGEAAKEAGVDRLEYVPNNGESILQFQARVVNALNKIKDTHKEKSVLMITHGGVIVNILIEVFGMPKEISEYHTDNGSITIIDFSQVPPKIEFNKNEHVKHLS